jgi:hypothetical protein
MAWSTAQADSAAMSSARAMLPLTPALDCEATGRFV